MRILPLLAILALSITSLVGCGSKDCPAPAQSVAPAPTKPRAALSFAPAMPGVDVPSMTRSVARDASSNSTYQLGNIDSTTTYLFMLRNTGSLPLVNIQLASDNPDVVITPNSIGILSPDGSGGMSPIIQVSVKHGSGIGHYGYAPLLTPGSLSFGISASAVNGLDSVLARATLTGTVRVADFTLGYIQAGDAAVHASDLRNVETHLGLFADGMHPSSWVGNYWYGTVADAAPTRVITNTGSAPLVVEVHDVIMETANVPRHSVLRETVTVAPGETYQATSHLFAPWDPAYGSVYTTNFKVWSQGVVFDPANLTNITDDVIFIQSMESIIPTGNG